MSIDCDFHGLMDGANKAIDTMALFLKNLLFTLIVPGTVAGLLPNWLFRPFGASDAGPPAMIAGALFILFGLGLYLASILPFAVIGRGTPAPIDAPRQLVVTGPYRYVRNPMYMAVLAVIFGQGLFWLSLNVTLYGAGVAILFSLFVIGYEEPVLRNRFGKDYEDYCRTVARWIPSVAGGDSS